MKSETRETVLMILRADPTVTQVEMDVVAVALDGGALEKPVKVREAIDILGVSRRQLFYMAKVGKLKKVMGIGSRGIGFTRASITGCALSLTLKKTGYA